MSAPRIATPKDFEDATVQINKAFEQLNAKTGTTGTGVTAADLASLQTQITQLQTLSGAFAGGTGVGSPSPNPGGSTVVTDGTTITGDGVNTDISLVTPVTIANGGTGESSPSIVAGTGIGVSGPWPDQTIALQTPVAIANGGTGTATPTPVAGSNIKFSGTWPNQTITGNFVKVVLTAVTPYTVLATDYFIGGSSSAGADQVENLPAATGSGHALVVKKMDSNAHNIAITPNGTDTIDGVNAAVNITIQYDVVRLIDSAAGAWSIW